MALRKLIIILSSLAVPAVLHAQTAAYYLHRGAQEYIFGHDGAAKAAVLGGLEKFPNDPELNQMGGLFKDEKKDKQQQEEQSQKNQQKQNQDQQQSSQQQQSQDQQSQSQNEQNKNDQSQARNEQQDRPQLGLSETPTPSPSENKQEEQNGGQSSPSPSPGSESPTPAETPEDGEGSGENATPSPGPSISPGKKMAGELKEAGEQKPDQTAQAVEAEEEKEGQMSERQALALLQSMKDEEARVRLDERKAARRVYKDW